MSQEPLVELRDIEKTFGRVQALSKINLKLYPGEIVSLVGDNGAGKSTLLKLLLGELMPTKGMLRRHHHLKISSYQQHTVDQLSRAHKAMTQSPVVHAGSPVQLKDWPHRETPPFLCMRGEI